MKVSQGSIPEKICCYSIKNAENGYFYIGYSTNAKKRITRHFSLLRNNKHPCDKLQKDYSAYGKDVFEIRIYGSEWGVLFKNMEFAFIRHAVDNNAPIYNALVPLPHYSVKNQLFGDYARMRNKYFNIFDFDYYGDEKRMVI